ncbi:hypothetical protein PVAP13_7KG062400 [Panicum virgatum]|uniref:Uncharacterized protein n=2 Tax=Panicum virgatum TaxID=38727 RepID=A0A8T0QK05_PANVG|nr:hypothetical protein PVAP13_7KG062400 [Panicum virgatum]
MATTQIPPDPRELGWPAETELCDTWPLTELLRRRNHSLPPPPRESHGHRLQFAGDRTASKSVAGGVRSVAARVRSAWRRGRSTDPLRCRRGGKSTIPMATRAPPPPHSSSAGSVTVTVDPSPSSSSSAPPPATAAPAPAEAVVLRLKRRGKKKVSWKEGTVDNEGLGRKSSKKCCIFHKEVPFDEDCSDDEAPGGGHRCPRGDAGEGTSGSGGGGCPSSSHDHSHHHH